MAWCFGLFDIHVKSAFQHSVATVMIWPFVFVKDLVGIFLSV